MDQPRHASSRHKVLIWACSCVFFTALYALDTQAVAKVGAGKFVWQARLSVHDEETSLHDIDHPIVMPTV